MRTWVKDHAGRGAAARFGMMWLAVVVVTLFGTAVSHGQAVMRSFTENTAPANWELVSYDPSGNYWFNGIETAATQTIAGAIGTADPSLTTVWMKSGYTVGASGYLVFDYEVQQNQATAAELSVYRLDSLGPHLLATLTGTGTYRSDSVFSPSDRIAFELSSTLSPSKLDGAAYANITPIPEPGDWAIVAGIGLLFYAAYRRGSKGTMFAPECGGEQQARPRACEPCAPNLPCALRRA